MQAIRGNPQRGHYRKMVRAGVWSPGTHLAQTARLSILSSVAADGATPVGP